ANLDVDVVAYGGFEYMTYPLLHERSGYDTLIDRGSCVHSSDPHAAVIENRSIHIHEMKQWPRVLQQLPKLFSPLVLLLKPVYQFFMLIWFLCFKIPAPDVFIVQVNSLLLH
ncbi:Udp-glycosyltransferase turan, partial [Thalictrum thalictroides]